MDLFIMVDLLLLIGLSVAAALIAVQPSGDHDHAARVPVFPGSDHVTWVHASLRPE
jgi:hypothetical protein